MSFRTWCTGSSGVGVGVGSLPHPALVEMGMLPKCVGEPEIEMARHDVRAGSWGHGLDRFLP
jgi:hypothetical protein